MNVPAKIAAGAAALTLTGLGIAGATGSPPSNADNGLSTAESHVGTDLPATPESHPTPDAHGGGSGASPDAPPTDTLGAVVSAFATTTDLEGADKGAAISELARQGHGPDDTSDSHATGLDTAAEASDGASTEGSSHASPHAAAGAENADGHGPS